MAPLGNVHTMSYIVCAHLLSSDIMGIYTSPHARGYVKATGNVVLFNKYAGLERQRFT